MEIIFLGCGTSVGVPMIGCDCPVCTSNNPKNRRTRASVAVRSGETTLLVDSGPDLHWQALRENLRRLDAVLYTHEHLDHVAGFDELRAFCWRREDPLPLYAVAGCLHQLRTMYAWAFCNQYHGYVRPEAHEHGNTPFCVGDIEVTPVPVQHGTVETCGYVFRSGGASFGYVPDVKEIPEASRPLLQGLTALAMDGLNFDKAHRSHMSVQQSAEEMQALRAELGVVTHTSHSVEYEAVSRNLPKGVILAYDGLRLEL
ncbi:MAG: MBL fold metallo-hydrolase [Akkermansia muciniphila]|nr:MBL fold metallo-hydrolase [Akkermansia muciniphila]